MHTYQCRNQSMTSQIMEKAIQKNPPWNVGDCLHRMPLHELNAGFYLVFRLRFEAK